MLQQQNTAVFKDKKSFDSDTPHVEKAFFFFKDKEKQRQRREKRSLNGSSLYLFRRSAVFTQANQTLLAFVPD
ncbi:MULTISPECIES: hypothetical protein [Virgibacillus]|uniref:hypothetical protein n=1 Tax=Virgibacillus TaxID=84406 RepID=UPI001C107931|nr:MULTISPECIES: hypothetical protein [Virgibacillus]MBU5265304.1 hypothetical protein [Virgibacillus proomii]